MSGIKRQELAISSLNFERSVVAEYKFDIKGENFYEPYDSRSTWVTVEATWNVRGYQFWDGYVARALCCFTRFFECFNCSTFRPKILYVIRLRHQRYTWTIMKSFSDVKQLLRKLRYLKTSTLNSDQKKMLKIYSGSVSEFFRLYVCCNADLDEVMRHRAENIARTLQFIVDNENLWADSSVRKFFEIGPRTFDSFWGAKGIEMYLGKSSGGYTAGYSRTCGDYFNVRRTRWVVFTPTQIVWYRSHSDPEIVGTLKITPSTLFYLSTSRAYFRDKTKRQYLCVDSATRSINFKCSDRTSADVLLLRVLDFYNRCSTNAQAFQEPSKFYSSFPARTRCDVRLYHVPKDYFSAAAIALLSAKKEIFIASWKNTPRIHLTRPPLPPLRLDQILAYKATQGVKVHIILYKEVELSGQGNDSGLAQSYLENLSPQGNIYVLRHPNKILGGSTAIMWSHHEKLTIIDRNLAFVGGIDMAVGRWDDEIKCLDDEDGLKYPGKDYRQPAEKMYPPARSLHLPSTDPNAKSTMGPGRNVMTNVMNMVNRTGGDVPVGEDESFTKGKLLPSKGADTIPPSTATLNAKTSLGPELLTTMSNHRDSPVPRNQKLTSSSTTSTTTKSTANLTKNQTAPLKQTPGEGWGSAALSFETRDLYPRSGWHDVHSCVSGLAARDVANHFVERWNHHRISTGENAKSNIPMLVYSNDNPSFGQCAKCQKTGISESITVCPACEHNLGSLCPLYTPPRPNQMPLPASPNIQGDYKEGQGSSSGIPLLEEQLTHEERQKRKEFSNKRAKESIRSYIEYSYELHEGFSCPIYGACPAVVVEPTERQHQQLMGISSSSNRSASQVNAQGSDAVPIPRYLTEGTMLCFSRDATYREAYHYNLIGKGTLLSERVHGQHQDLLINQGLAPQHGDCLVSVNGADVSHLDHGALGRFFSRVSCGASEYSRIHKDKVDALDDRGVKDSDSSDGCEEDHEKDFSADPSQEPGRMRGRRRGSLMTRSSMTDKSRVTLVFRRHHVPIDNYCNSESSLISSNSGCQNIEASVLGLRKRQYYSQLESAQMACRADYDLTGSFSSVLTNIAADIKVNTFSSTISALFGQNSDFAEDSPEYIRTKYLIQCAGSEVAYRMSELYAHFGVRAWLVVSHPNIILPHSPYGSTSLQYKVPLIARNACHQGTCRVQVLRSVGTWSLGVLQPETSIMQGWIDAITNAEHFIYIENQFFIGNNKFVDTKGKKEIPENDITAALLARLVTAARNRELFKVIIIIPQHPQGDVIYSMRPRSILHYQAETIDKGVNSIFARFSSLCPGVNPKTYINFYCLQNFGIINDRFMHDQIYVHDKLCIVDDRVMIVGSANINDRSMLGDRDTEVALHVMDRSEVSITLGGKEAKVGVVPHEARVRLMRMHLGDKKNELNVDDVLSPAFFDDLWDARAHSNASLYCAVDGPKNIYGELAKNLLSYRTALEAYENPTVYDEDVETAIENLKGFLIPYPHSFLYNEDLRPNLALRGIIPERLWV